MNSVALIGKDLFVLTNFYFIFNFVPLLTVLLTFCSFLIVKNLDVEF